MLRVLQHYLPIRTALLFLGETAILTLVVSVLMSMHLWEALRGIRAPGFDQLMVDLYPMDVWRAFWVCVLSSMVVSLLCQTVIGLNRLYEFHISASPFERSARFVESAGAGIALALVSVSLTEAWDLDYVLNFPGISFTHKLQYLVASLVTGFSLLYVWRIVYHWLMRKTNLNQRILVLGSKGPAHELVNVILYHPEAGYEVAGLIPEYESPDLRSADDDAEDGAEPSLGGDSPKLAAPQHVETPESRALVLDSVTLMERTVVNRGVAMAGHGGRDLDEEQSLLALARKMQVDMLVVALENRRSTLPLQDMLRCRLDGLDVREREEIFEQITGKIAVAAMRPSYLIFNEGFRRHPWADLMKRVADVVLSVVLLALTWPLMILTAIAVRMDSPGPTFFKQDRVGQDGKRFTLIKFRSMLADAERHTGPVWTSEDDPRITRVGRVIRGLRLDELPQLFNVLVGHMSLVGPRPEREHFVEELADQIPYYHQRHIVKPGVTGWAQINYPYGNTIEDALHKLQYDLFYIKNHSVLFDLSILFSTIKTVVLRRGT